MSSFTSALQGNTRVDPPEEYISTMDTIVVYEGTGLPTGGFAAWHQSYDHKKFGCMADTISTVPDAVALAALSADCGWVYLTDGIQPSPYAALTSYYYQLVAALAPPRPSKLIVWEQLWVWG